MKPCPDIVRQALNGDTRAFSELVRRFTPMAAALAAQRLRDPSLTEDAVQDAFLAAWLHLPGLRNPDAFPGWLRSIVIRSCHRALREARAGVMTSDFESLEHIPSDDLDPFEHYARFQTRDMVRTFLSSLSGVCRDAAIQRYLLGLSYEDISKALGVPVGTIKRRLHETRTRMLRAMGERHTRTLRVGYLPISDHLLPMIAHQRHDQATFGVCLRKFLSWAELTRALINESLDAAMMMAPLAMVLHNRGAPIKWILDGHHEGSAITMQASMAGSMARSGSSGWPRDLAGAALGLPHAMSTHGMLLRSVLGFGQAGGPGSFRAVYMSPSAMNRPLTRRSLDGFFCAEPWGMLAEATGAGKVLIRSRELAPDHVCCVLVVRTAFSRAHPDLLADYLSLLRSAADYAHAKPLESAAIQSRYTGVDRDAAASVLTRGFVNFRDLSPDRARVEGTMGMALQAGMLDRPCNLDDLLLSSVN